MKNFQIKKVNGEKTMVVNNIQQSPVLELYIKSKKESLNFAVKTSSGFQYWSLDKIASFYNIKDTSIIIKAINN